MSSVELFLIITVATCFGFVGGFLIVELILGD